LYSRKPWSPKEYAVITSKASINNNILKPWRAKYLLTLRLTVLYISIPAKMKTGKPNTKYDCLNICEASYRYEAVQPLNIMDAARYNNPSTKKKTINFRGTPTDIPHLTLLKNKANANKFNNKNTGINLMKLGKNTDTTNTSNNNCAI